MKTAKKALFFIFAVWCLFALPYAYALFLPAATITNTGNLHAIGVSINVASIDWGIIDPGQTKVNPVTVTNTGNQPITLNMITDNWNPTLAATYFTLTWNYNAETILPQQSQTVQFSLTVSADIDPSITDFSFDTTITGVQA